MEDQGKRLLLAVGIIAVMYIAWTTFFAPKPPPAAAPTPTQTADQAQAPAAPGAATSAPAVAADSSAPAAAPGATPAAAGTAPVVAAAADCVVETEGAPQWDTKDYVATFSRCGGALQHFQLKGTQYENHDADGHATPIDLVRTGQNPAFFPFQVQVKAPASGGTNGDENRVPIIAAKATWDLVAQSDKEVVYRWVSPDKALLVTKTFKRIDAETRYTFQLDVEVKNVSEKKDDKRLVETSVAMYGYQDPAAPGPSMFHYAEPAWGTACYADGKQKHDSLKDLTEETRIRSGEVKWTGLDHQYFLLAAAPLDKEQVVCTNSLIKSSPGVMESELGYVTPTTLEPNQSVKESMVVYVGPKLIEALEQVGTVVGKDVRLSASVDLGWFGFIGRPMLTLLKLFYGWVGNWGVAIIMLTLTIKLLTLYWTNKSMKSMKAMSRLKPEMDKIKAQYKDDKTRQQTEMMNLYKRHQVSPFGGCLPMLLQMPIWFALYQTLRSAADLYRAPFLGWIHDLTAPDPLHIIPVVLTGLMFLQARLSPAAVDSQQQKMMQYIMPVMFGFMSLVFPAGLAIYMFTNTLLSMTHQLYINRNDPPRGSKVAASSVIEVTASPTPPSSSSSSSSSSPPPRKKGGGRKNKMVKA